MTEFPDHDWAHASPDSLGFDAARLNTAVEFAQANETPWPRDLGTGLGADPDNNEPPPWNEVLGPTLNRDAPNGLVIRNGHVAARWGDPVRVDMTYSATKSYLGLLAGIAVGDGLIPSVDDRVGDSPGVDQFDTERNRAVTWRHLLQQTSEWEGTIWGKPDLIDRHRQVGPGSDDSRKGTHRELGRPGTFWEYNDVRVNLLSLSLMQVFRQPLPEVLAERIMQPIGASDTWRWHHYRNAEHIVDGRAMFGVPGGAHWGGGLFISSTDHARVGWLVRQRGRWGPRQLIDESWFDAMLEPCALNPIYGYLWWLNTDRKLYPSAPENSFAMFGAGYNVVWIAPDHDLVCVLRWIDSAAVDGFLDRLMLSLHD